MKVTPVRVLLLVVSLPLLAASETTGAAQLTHQHASGGKQRRSEQLERRAAYWWQTALDFFNPRDDGNSGDLPPPAAAKRETSSLEVPGEAGPEADEMLADRLAPSIPASSPGRRSSLLLAHSRVHSAASSGLPQAELAEAQAHGFMIGARFESEGTDSMWHRTGSRDEAATVPDFHAHSQRKKYIEEYDELPEQVAVGQSRSRDIVSGKESTSKEDLQRVQAGDIEINHPVTMPRKKLRRLLHRPRKVAALRQRSQQLASASASQLPPGNAKMQAQCESYASFLKGQNVGGPDLVKAWSGTCMPAVHAGKATPKYSTMCSALVGAVEPFSLDTRWSPAEVCKAVVRVFKESGLGATPLQGFF
mmetsp:Transcript_106334/g.184838  ORF Transcript_106334/g.184838 Transcript_106334/m.184838 type:complete len:363 (-) Transcript_106334:124-1212(-)